MAKDKKNPEFLLGEINTKVDYIKERVEQLAINLKEQHKCMNDQGLKIEKQRGMIEVLNTKLVEHLKRHTLVLVLIPIIVGIITFIVEVMLRIFL